MIVWEDPKNPTEVKDYAFDWVKDLGDDTISSCSAALLAGNDGGLTIEQDDGYDGTLSFVWVSGGTAGLKALIRGTIVTVGGRTFTELGMVNVSETVDPTTDTVEDLQADLAKLKSARLSMLTGTGVKEVWRDGRRIVYNVASMADLDRAIRLYEDYILKAQVVTGASNGRFRALSVRF